MGLTHIVTSGGFQDNRGNIHAKGSKVEVPDAIADYYGMMPIADIEAARAEVAAEAKAAVEEAAMPRTPRADAAPAAPKPKVHAKVKVAVKAKPKRK